MFVLMKLMPNERPHNDDVNETAAAAFDKFCEVYEDQVRDPEVYLHRPDGMSGGIAEEISFRDGKTEADFIRVMAKNWNKTLADTFDKAFSVLEKTVPTNEDGARDWLKCDIYKIYDMKRAAMALDGQLYDFADYALLVRNHITTKLEPAELEDIMNHPENYVFIDAQPK